jgi:uncharacterized protein (TIRG00374 family)
VKNKLILLAKIAIMVLLFYLILRKVGVHKFYQTLIGANISYLFAAMAVLWFGHLLCVARWKILLDVFRMHFSYLRLVAIYAVGAFFNSALPTAIGGDVVKLYLTGREANGSYMLSFASVFMDRNIGMFAMVIIAFISCLFHPVSINGIPLLPVAALILVGFVMANLILFHPRSYALVTKLLHKKFPKVADRLDVLSNAFTAVRKDKSALLKTFLLSVINQGASISMNWLIALALGEHISFVYFLIFVPMVTLVVMVPITVSGLGLRESAFWILLSSIGIPREKSLAIGFIASMIVIISSLPGGIVYIFFKKHGTMRNLEEAKAI